MSFLSFFPTRDIALTLGPLTVHWYGVMYALSFIVGIWMLPRLSRLTKLELTTKDQESLFLSIFLGVLLGGRLGFVLFYGDGYFLEHPAEIFAVWQGGMSSHGGFIGVAVALLLFAYRKSINFFRLTDTIVVPVAIGLALGRLGNFINGELYGTVTTLPWGMSFPGVEGLRHPTQLYAIAKDLSIAIVCFLTLRRYSNVSIGVPTGLFLMMYAVLRFIVEIFRDQPYGFTNILGAELSRGQLLTIPVFVIGLIVILFRRSLARSTESAQTSSSL